MKKRISTILVALMVIAGLSLLLYPTVSNYIYSRYYRRTIQAYQAAVQEIDTAEYERMLAEAREYNQRLLKKGTRMRDPSEAELDEYYSILDPLGFGVMGYVEILKVDISLPIYHGVSDGVLQSGIGHIPGTSLPVGGEGVHSIISGHRGLTSARLFTDIDQLVEGDTITIRVLNEVLTYEVDQIITILPEELGLQEIDPEQDYCTLLTCTPYGINTHRLLVRGHRIPTPEEPEGPADTFVPVEEAPNNGWIYLLAAAGVVLLVGLLVLLRLLRKRKRYQPKRLQPQGSQQKLLPEPKKEQTLELDLEQILKEESGQKSEAESKPEPGSGPKPESESALELDLKLELELGLGQLLLQELEQELGSER